MTDRGERVVKRRRGEHLEADILAAAWDELVEHGWVDFNMPRVAARAGTGKASVYSRWPNKAAIVAAAAHRHTRFSPNPLNLGRPLEETLVWILQGAADLFAGPFGSVARALASEFPTIPEHVRRPFDSTRPVQVALQVVEHAQATGELGPGPIEPQVVNAGFDLLTQRFLLSSEPPGPEVVRSIVTSVWLPALRAAGAARDAVPKSTKPQAG